MWEEQTSYFSSYVGGCSILFIDINVTNGAFLDYYRRIVGISSSCRFVTVFFFFKDERVFFFFIFLQLL